MSLDDDYGRLEFSAEELLADVDYGTPLIANGVLCHGGFDADGRYLPPRTRHRNPAVQAWQRRLQGDGLCLIDVPDSQVPPQYPSVEQARLLLRAGLREPIVRALTVISIVEGFGAVIRDVRVPDLSALVVEPIGGTALAHLGTGLFEAHARDEAGYGEQGGHKQMWEAARDLALENPRIPPDVFMRLMGDRGQARARQPLFPQLDFKLYRMIATMAQVLVIEIFAKSTFDWGIALLSDPDVSAKPQQAGTMVSHIRDDESPHVEYLRTALSELRGRTLRTVDGDTLAGQVVVDGLLHRILARLRADRPREQRDDTRGALLAAVETGGASSSLLEEFDALAPSWHAPELTGFESAA